MSKRLKHCAPMPETAESLELPRPPPEVPARPTQQQQQIQRNDEDDSK
jgi:hypothetical protein